MSLRLEPVSVGYKAGYAYSRGVPRAVADLTARVAAAATPHVLPHRGAMTELNLRRVRGAGLTGEQLADAVRATFRSYGRYWIESFRLPGLSPAVVDSSFDYEGLVNLGRAREQGLGPILVLPHLGGWEWAGVWLTQVLKVPVTVVVEPIEPPELFEFFAEFREQLGMRIVPLGPGAAAEVLRSLRDGHVVCLLADRDIGGDGVEVEMFGERTTLPAGPAVLAIRSGAPLLPAAVYFRGRRHYAVVEPPLPVERNGRLRDDVAAITQELAKRLEVLIRAAPEQWHLQQPNWPSDVEAMERWHRSRHRRWGRAAR